MNLEYYTAAKPSEPFLMKEKNSKFIAQCFPVRSQEEWQKQLQSVRDLHPKANHVCYAWRLGWDPVYSGCSDDGEPGYTAGIPILNQIEKNRLTHVLITVTRYFGGVKLGKGGLIRAYGTAAAGAAEQTRLQRILPRFSVRVLSDHAGLEKIRRMKKDFELLIEPDFTRHPIEVRIQCPLELKADFLCRLEEMQLTIRPEP